MPALQTDPPGQAHEPLPHESQAQRRYGERVPAHPPPLRSIIIAPGIRGTQEPLWLSKLGVLGAPLSGAGLKGLGVPGVGSNPWVFREKLQDLSSLPNVGGGAMGVVYGQTVSQPLLPASR